MDKKTLNSNHNETENPSENIFYELDKIVDDTIVVLEFITDNLIYNNVIVAENKRYDIKCANLISCMKTLSNIKYCCHNKSFADANVLMRKYRDDLFQYLYFHKVIKCYQKDFCAEIPVANNLKTHIKYIITWSTNSLSGYSNSDKKKFKYAMSASGYKSYLLTDKIIKECCEMFFYKTWEDIGDTCNDYTHNNSIRNIADNIRIHPKDVMRCLLETTENIKLLSIYFMSLLLLIDSHIFRSYDYEVALENGLSPIANSQYWIASLYQEYFNNYINVLSPELLEYLRRNNSHMMIIE